MQQICIPRTVTMNAIINNEVVFKPQTHIRQNDPVMCRAQKQNAPAGTLFQG